MKTRPWNRPPHRRPPRRPSDATLVRLACAVWLALAGAAVAQEGAAAPKPVSATVTKVNAGDSLEVKLETGAGRVRMSAIDTPEYDQPYGSQSSAALKALLPVGSKVELEVVTQDAFHRMVAVVWLTKDGQRINVNETMLREG